MPSRQTSLYPVHDSAGATFTAFGEWEMPVSYDSIRGEHEAVRTAVGKFDVSHMGQLAVAGPDAGTLLQRVTTNDVGTLEPGDGQYSAVTREDGVMVDDVVCYRLPPERETPFLVVPNAGHDATVAQQFRERRDTAGLAAEIELRTDDTAMIALQGTEAADLLARESDAPVDAMTRFDLLEAAVAGVDCLVARTGYTGEDGFEILCAWTDAEPVWSALGCQPCGLGARDTLRLEMGYLLSGQDFDPEENPRTPYEAGIDFVVDLDTEFVGRDALAQQAEAGLEQRLTGVRLLDRGVARTGYAVTTPQGDHLGTVTSGTVSPTLDTPIGLAYLPAEYAEPEREIRVLVRDEPKKSRTATTPFIDG